MKPNQSDGVTPPDGQGRSKVEPGDVEGGDSEETMSNTGLAVALERQKFE